jgi:hypothetical protein
MTPFDLGEFLVVKLNRAIKLRKYEIVAEKEYLNRAPGMFKLYAKVENTNNYKLLHNVDIRLSTSQSAVGRYLPILNTVRQQYWNYIKSICDNEIMSDTYVLVVTGLARQAQSGDVRKRRGNYLSFNEFNLYHGNVSTILTTHVTSES